jgi:NTP pyrophosphatase (non-canonical NTP hydrolase)
MNYTHIPADHRSAISRLYKGGNVLRQQLTDFDIDIWHAATGIATEAGELVEAVLPMVLANDFSMGHQISGPARGYVDPWDGNNSTPGVDIDNIKEELGDHLFYEGALRISTNLESLEVSSTVGGATVKLDLQESVSKDLWPLAVGPMSLANEPAVGRKRVLTDLILIHAALAGKILDVVKRVVIYRKGFEDVPEGGVSLKAKLCQHLIDDCWVVEQIAAVIGVSEEELREGNIIKLEKGSKDKKPRYGETYSDAAAIERADKQEDIVSALLADAIYGDGAEATRNLVAAQVALTRSVIAEGKDPDRVTARTLFDGIEAAPEDAIERAAKASADYVRCKLSQEGDVTT